MGQYEEFLQQFAYSPISAYSLARTVGLTMIVATFISMVFAPLAFSYNIFDRALEKIENKDAANLIRWREITRIFFLVVLLATYPAWITVTTGFVHLVNKISVLNHENAQQLDNITKVMIADGIKASRDEVMGESSIAYIINNPDKFEDNIVEMAKVMAEQKGIDTEDNKYKTIKFSELKKADQEKLNQYIQGKLDNSMAIDTEKRGWAAVKEVLRGIANILLKPFESILVAILYGISRLIRYFMILFIKGAFYLSVVIGPLSISTSFLMKNNIKTWIGAYLASGFALTSLNIVDHMMYLFANKYFMTYEGGAARPGDANIIYSIILIAAYLSIFKITSWWVGKSNISGLVSKGMAVGAGTIGAAASMFAMTKMPGTKGLSNNNAIKSIMDTASKAANMAKNED